MISTLPPGPGLKRLALTAVAFLAVICLFSLLFLRNVQLARLDVFVPVLDTSLFLLDLITAALLFAHFSVLGSRALLVLASGYLFTGLIIVSHGLTFPGAFSPTGLLGAGVQTSNYLQIFWRAGLPSFAIAYALLKDTELPGQAAGHSVRRHILASIAIVLAIVCGLTWLATAGAGLLPDIMIDQQKRIWPADAPFIIPLEVAALALVWRRRRSVLDSWLLVVLCAWLMSSILAATTNDRFSLPWYESRIYGLLASSFVLFGLLLQMTALYMQFALSIAAQQRERENRLMEMDAALALVSHEISQPLTAISINGRAGLRQLAQARPDPDALGEIFKDIDRDCHRIGEIIRSIRALFKHETHANEEIDIVGLIEGTLRLVRYDLEGNGIVIGAELNRELPAVLGNRVQLQQVFLNLIGNAIDALKRVQIRRRLLRIRADIDDSGNAIVVTVEDSGPGVEAKIGDRIFDPFVTTKPRGMGLGLSICRIIVSAHGGQLSATPVSPQGTAFRLLLPMQMRR